LPGHAPDRRQRHLRRPAAATAASTSSLSARTRWRASRGI